MNAKRILALLLAVLTMFSLAACGSAPAAAPAEEEAPAAEPAAEDSAPAEIDYTGEKLVIWTNLTADAQYEGG